MPHRSERSERYRKPHCYQTAQFGCSPYHLHSLARPKRLVCGSRDLAVQQPLLQRVYRTCDFEGIVTLVLALSEPNAFRVLTLDGLRRLVVDVRR
ncbi:MAG TPA: hypothetical protein VM198_08260 [Longimicrobiales bacterium]|nr:hypothetical protein [Longimicrobiales bacterium]